jgi:hypothetical protein
LKTCYSCKVEKPFSEFYKNNVSYYQKECKACNGFRKSDWYKTPEGKESSARSKLKSRFGISIEQYNIKSESQGNVCDICKLPCRTGAKLSVDHDHTTGKIRNLLCRSCNLGIGNFLDNKELLKEAINYLDKFK